MKNNKRTKTVLLSYSGTDLRSSDSGRMKQRIIAEPGPFSDFAITSLKTEDILSMSINPRIGGGKQNN